MHEDFKAFSQKPTQKFHTNFINFEKPQKFSKTQKLRLKIMKSMNMRDLKTYQEKKNVIKVKRHDKIERDQENEDRIAFETLYRCSIILDRWRCQGRCQALKVSIDAAIERCPEVPTAK